MPVIGLGLLTQFLAPEVALLVFAGLLVTAVAAAAPGLLRRPDEPARALSLAG